MGRLADDEPDHFTPASLRVELVLLTVRDGRLAVLLVKRHSAPFQGCWALPGGGLGDHEDLDAASQRLLTLTTGLEHDPWHAEQLRSYVSAVPSQQTAGAAGSASERSDEQVSAQRSVSVAYMVFMPVGTDPAPGSAAEAFRWWAVDDLSDDGPVLAFDHASIIADAVDRCRSKLEYTTVAASFLQEPFTLGELRRIYENVWGVKLHHSNFARKLTSSPGYLVAEVDGSPGRATLYRRGSAQFVMPPIPRPVGE